MYKRSGDLKFATVRRRDFIARAEVESTLRQAGMTADAIAEWIAKALEARPSQPKPTAGRSSVVAGESGSDAKAQA